MKMTRTRATVAAVAASVGLAAAAVPAVSQAMPPQGGGAGCRYMGYQFENGTAIAYDGIILACQQGQVRSIGYV
ncbi:MAG TPA: hypothetical protein VHW26_12530 [Solirubrobacteraceae bacterium]|jgi:hypothetical protein|nr:hypothetical protein [Solirubrobacteraceae bacterium]